MLRRLCFLDPAQNHPQYMLMRYVLSRYLNSTLVSTLNSSTARIWAEIKAFPCETEVRSRLVQVKWARDMALNSNPLLERFKRDWFVRRCCRNAELHSIRLNPEVAFVQYNLPRRRLM